jgi:hypothetical protein
MIDDIIISSYYNVLEVENLIDFNLRQFYLLIDNEIKNIKFIKY